VRNVLSFFKRRPSEVNTPLPSIDVVESWSHNFSNLLNDKYGLMLFRNFLCSEYSEENIEFWIACEEYKQLKTRQFAPRAQKIYSDYVTVHAPKEVNLDSKTRLETMKNLSAPDKLTFNLAQSRIQCLMEKDSYTRFLKSHFYTTVLTQARAPASDS